MNEIGKVWVIEIQVVMILFKIIVLLFKSNVYG